MRGVQNIDAFITDTVDFYFANFFPFIYFNHVHQFLKTFPYFWKQNFTILNFSKKGRPLSKNYTVAIFQRESMPIDPLSSLNTK